MKKKGFEKSETPKRESNTNIYRQEKKNESPTFSSVWEHIFQVLFSKRTHTYKLAFLYPKCVKMSLTETGDLPLDLKL